VTGTAEGRLVAEVLGEYGAIARAGLGRWLPAGEPRSYLSDLIADYPSRGGRMLRPSLCLATARVFGASLEDALPAAVCVELLHNALLIHDDVEDESDERRGRPTLHRLAGVPLAINAGDSLALLSLRPLFHARDRLGGLLALRMLDEFDRMAQETAEGQALDIGWRRDNVIEVSEAEYLEMVLKKTCWLTTLFPIRLGALIGTRDRIDLDRFLRFGFFLGAAFQIQDDLLNLVGDPERYGKEIAGDLLEGKRTLMLIRLLELAAPDERQRIRAVLATARERRRPASVRWLCRRMDELDCIGYASELAHGLAGAAMHEFDLLFSAFPDSRDKRFLGSLPKWVLERA
jgi:geranylgeranyl diphosphate synthase type II